MGAAFSTLAEMRNAWVWSGKSQGKILC